MGGTTFFRDSSGETLQQAFQNSVENAKHRHGHGGYTGTIAEKNSVTEIPQSEVPEEMTAMEYAQQLIEEGDSRIDSKWGPAGAIKLGDDPSTWLLFGWASC